MTRKFLILNFVVKMRRDGSIKNKELISFLKDIKICVRANVTATDSVAVTRKFRYANKDVSVRFGGKCGFYFTVECGAFVLLVEKGKVSASGYSDLVLVNREFIWSNLLRAIRLYNHERRRVK